MRSNTGSHKHLIGVLALGEGERHGSEHAVAALRDAEEWETSIHVLSALIGTVIQGSREFSVCSGWNSEERPPQTSKVKSKRVYEFLLRHAFLLLHQPRSLQVYGASAPPLRSLGANACRRSLTPSRETTASGEQTRRRESGTDNNECCPLGSA